MFTRERGGGFKLVTSASLSMVPSVVKIQKRKREKEKKNLDYVGNKITLQAY
jgi:hypothetical protein